MRDDELLDALGRTLLPDPPASPSGDEVRSFLAEVAGVPVAAARPRRRLLPRFLAGGLAVALVGGGTAYAAGDGSRIPAPVRRAAVAIRLPVDSPEVADAKKELADLEEAIGRGDADRIAKAIEDVEEALSELSAGERASIDSRLRELLALASSAVAASAPVVTSTGSDDAADDERDDRGESARDVDDADGTGEEVEAADAEDPDRDDEIVSGGEDNSGSGSATSGSSNDDSREPEPDDDHVDESDSSGSGSSDSEEPDDD